MHLITRHTIYGTFVLLFLLCSRICIAQSTATAPAVAQKLAAATSDTGRVNILLAYATSKMNSNGDESRVYGERALEEAERCGWELGKYKALHLLGSTSIKLRDIDAAEDYYIRAIPLAEAAGYEKGLLRSQGGLASIYRYKGDYEKALELAETSVATARRIGDQEAEIAIAFNLSNLYQRLGRPQDRIDVLLQLNERPLDPHAASKVNGSLCQALAKSGQDSLALSYCYLSLSYGDLETNVEGYYYSRLRLAEYYEDRERYDSVQYYFRQIVDSIDNPNKRFQGLLGMAQTAVKQEQFEAANTYVERLTALQPSTTSPNVAMEVAMVRGEVAFARGMYRQALPFFEDVITYARRARPDIYARVLSLKLLSESYLGKATDPGEWETAMSLRDSVAEAKRSAVYLETIERYRNDSLVAFSEMQEQQNEIQALTVGRQRKWILGMLFLALMLGTGAFFFRRLSRQRGELNEQLRSANKEILTLKAAGTHATLHSYRSFRRAISEAAKGEDMPPAVGTFLGQLDRSILAYYTLQQMTDNNVAAPVELRAYINNLEELYCTMELDDGARLELSTDEVDSFFVHYKAAESLAVILNELITNTQKYGKREGDKVYCHLEVTQQGESIWFEYNDDGPRTDVPADIPSSGEGLQHVATLVKELKGETKVTSGYSHTYRFPASSILATPSTS